MTGASSRRDCSGRRDAGLSVLRGSWRRRRRNLVCSASLSSCLCGSRYLDACRSDRGLRRACLGSSHVEFDHGNVTLVALYRNCLVISVFFLFDTQGTWSHFV